MGTPSESVKQLAQLALRFVCTKLVAIVSLTLTLTFPEFLLCEASELFSPVPQGLLGRRYVQRSCLVTEKLAFSVAGGDGMLS